jgi:signal transduction histidine kinase
MKTPVIVCVDDEKTLLWSLQAELMHAMGNDYLIETAENGEDALELIGELLEDDIELPLVISDQLMPGLSGDELLQKIHLIAPNTFKILLTGIADVNAVGNAIKNANLYRYIAKPWDHTDLLLTVREAIHSYFQEKELAQFYAGLEKKVAERTQQLREKNEFLSMAVHDLKNPLSAIQGFSEMIKRHFDDIPKETVIEFADQIYISSWHMFEVIKSILDINALEAGKMALSIKKVEVREIVEWFVNHYIERAKAKNIILAFQSKEEQCDAMADEKSLRQVLDNLISNAIKYSPHDKHISVHVSKNDKFVRCEIQDEGPGLSDADQEQLFGQFTRLTPKPTGDEHSTGLGLFIVKKMMDSMQGKVWCESVLGQGATFIVEFPVA